MTFSHPDAEPAQIAVYDLAGGGQFVRREVGELEVGALGPGDHTLELTARGSLRPGIYLVRIWHGAESLLARVSVLR